MALRRSGWAALAVRPLFGWLVVMSGLAAIACGAAFLTPGGAAGPAFAPIIGLGIPIDFWAWAYIGAGSVALVGVALEARLIWPGVLVAATLHTMFAVSFGGFAYTHSGQGIYGAAMTALSAGTGLIAAHITYGITDAPRRR